MIFICGGKASGKLSFATTKFPELKVGQCSENNRIDIKNNDILNDFELFIKYLIVCNIRPSVFIQDNLNLFKDKIIIGNDIGCGVVPNEPCDRYWRDETGFCFQILARNAQEVYRVWCGIPTKL